MKHRYISVTTVMMVLLFSISNIFSAFSEGARGLWACQNTKRNGVFVSWRMRSTDSPKSTTYKLYADGNLVQTLTDRTNASLDISYANAVFSVEVLDRDGNVIDREGGVRCDDYCYHRINVDKPADYTLPDGTVVSYEPNDCSAFDMDGDGQQEIIATLFAGIGATASPTAPPVLQCFKLDGTKLWEINLGPNILAGCRFSFLCYDFDGDGKGEVITKTAPGSRDASGNFLSKGVAQGANHYASSITNGVITDGGKEWITVFDGVTGKELQTIDYWPYFNIQSDWDDRPNNTDGNAYGHRGNWLKGCVAFLDVNGKPTPCAVNVRGIYTYSYAAAYTWDGKNLTTLWRHTSDKPGQGIYAEGAHSLTCGDVDGDGFDEVIVGAACIDHNGNTLWRTGFGHGDATHLGEFDPDNEGLEYFMITEESSAPYNCALLDAKTGKILVAKAQTGGDTGRGLILNCDSTARGSEFMDWSDPELFSCKGDVVGETWHNGSTTSSSINTAIFWDGDLLEEYQDRSHCDKWDNNTKTWGRCFTYYNPTGRLGVAANTNNSTKYNPCLQADLYGDWREEIVSWGNDNGQLFLNIFTTTMESPYKLPWLRDDHVYDMAVAWQHCGYNQPPHLGYSPEEYYKKLNQPANLIKNGAGSSSQEITLGEAIVDFAYKWENATSVSVEGLPKGVEYNINYSEERVYISGTPTEGGEFQFIVTTIGNEPDARKKGKIIVHFVDAPEIVKHGAGSSNQTLVVGDTIEEFSYSWSNCFTVVVEGLPNGVVATIDNDNKTVSFSGTTDDLPGEYDYTITTQGGTTDVVTRGTFVIKDPDVQDPDIQDSGIDDVEKVKFYVAPNPMLTSTTVCLENADETVPVKWKINDMSGIAVLFGNENTNKFTIERGDLSDGIYVLTITTEMETITKMLVVK